MGADPVDIFDGDDDYWREVDKAPSQWRCWAPFKDYDFTIVSPPRCNAKPVGQLGLCHYHLYKMMGRVLLFG